ncbi:GGDEF domain-containing protein [Noviherbaspirillum galbum]|uniref:diguanylate cyclase n=1 Tax=Noviherbaspirillum galbum TaxID=2709383 RepID=A0A6B3SX77_9BURK|nr:GGDEF domain-containing protein [Noviherbaspirillum galbum]NEX63072.1 GGDEF domain-containing protein [Noviherbaspirillum galbum]
MSGLTMIDRVERALSRRGLALAFEPALEARFETDTCRQRERMLLISGAIAIAVYDAFLINDLGIRPEIFGLSLLLRLGVMTPIGLLVLALLHRGNLRPAFRESMMSASVVISMCLSNVLFLLSTSPEAMFDPFSFGLIILGGNIVFSLRFPFALASTCLNLVLVAVFLSLSTEMHGVLKVFVMMVGASTGLFTLAAGFRLEASERRSYLLMLREKLRAETMQEHNQMLTLISHTDPLTKLGNRRQFDKAMDRLRADTAMHHLPVGMLIIDIDNFKAFNDLHGHLEGDACLCRVGETIEAQVRRGMDVVARLGGEEFAVLMPECDRRSIEQAGERIRLSIETLSIRHGGTPGSPVVTVSLGMALGVLGAPDSGRLLYQLADKALYDAKRGGRNRAVLADASPAAGDAGSVPAAAASSFPA